MSLDHGRDRLHSRVANSVKLLDPRWDREVIGKAAVFYSIAFPGLAVVSDGDSEGGRGTTLFDIFRVIGGGTGTPGGRVDLCGLKTAKIESSGKWPSHFTVCTALGETLDAVLSGASRGAAIPTMFIVEDPSKTETVWAAFLDLGALLRAHGPVYEAPDGGFGRNRAPTFSLGWEKRNSGIKRFAAGRREHEGMTYPFDEARGKRWLSPTRVAYLSLRVHANAAGLNKGSGAWSQIHLTDLAAYLNTQPWDKLAMLYPEYR